MPSIPAIARGIVEASASIRNCTTYYTSRLVFRVYRNSHKYNVRTACEKKTSYIFAVVANTYIIREIHVMKAYRLQ